MDTNSKRSPVILLSALLAAALLTIAYFAYAHISRTYEFNNTDRIYCSADEPVDCEVEITKKGTWPKDDSLIEGANTGSQYDVVMSNNSVYEMAWWRLRIDIRDECYLNQDWNGKVVIHQNVASGHEKVQELDLHDFKFDVDKMILEHVGSDKNDLMIHLYEGDYLLYLPTDDSSFNEMPIRAYNGAPGSTTAGLIFYYDSDREPQFTDYTVTYRFNKSPFQGSEFIALLSASALWLLLAIIFTLWRVMKKRADHELREREAMLEETLDLISHFVDAKDPYTNGHSERVAKYSFKLAQKLGFSARNARYAFYAGMLHDVGKCYVPNEILKKPGRLTDSEYETIKSHTSSGYEMLRSIRSIPGIADGAHYHHERYDGKGYPERIGGLEIPYLARIICVADSFDAMNSTRCYRNQLTKEKIIEELRENKGRQFDPDVVEAMLALIDAGEISFDDIAAEPEE